MSIRLDGMMAIAERSESVIHSIIFKKSVPTAKNMVQAVVRETVTTLVVLGWS